MNKDQLIKISPRELACLRLLAEGYNSKQAATRLCVEVDTIRSFVRRMKDKFEVDTLYEIIQKARAERII